MIDIGGTTLLYTQERSGQNLVKKLTGQGPTKHSIQIYVRMVTIHIQIETIDGLSMFQDNNLGTIFSVFIWLLVLLCT